MSRLPTYVVAPVALFVSLVWAASPAGAVITNYFVNNFEADTPNTGDRSPNSAFMWKQDFVHTQTYDVNGGMTKPTFARNSGDSGAAATAGGNFHVNDTDPSGLSGFSTNNVAIYTHPIHFGGTSEGVVQLRDTSGNSPFTGTNTGGFQWKFDMSLTAQSKQQTSTWNVRPSIALQSNFGTDAVSPGYNDLVRVRWDNGNIVLDHAGGTTTLVSNYDTTTTLNSTPYHFEAQLDMDTDTYRMLVNGISAGNFSMLFAGNATRGIGGYEIHGGRPDEANTTGPSGTNEGFMSFYDNISLSVPEPSSAALVGLVGAAMLRRCRQSS